MVLSLFLPLFILTVLLGNQTQSATARKKAGVQAGGGNRRQDFTTTFENIKKDLYLSLHHNGSAWVTGHQSPKPRSCQPGLLSSLTAVLPGSPSAASSPSTPPFLSPSPTAFPSVSTSQGFPDSPTAGSSKSALQVQVPPLGPTHPPDSFLPHLQGTQRAHGPLANAPAPQLTLLVQGWVLGAAARAQQGSWKPISQPPQPSLRGGTAPPNQPTHTNPYVCLLYTLISSPRYSGPEPTSLSQLRQVLSEPACIWLHNLSRPVSSTPLVFLSSESTFRVPITCVSSNSQQPKR